MREKEKNGGREVSLHHKSEEKGNSIHIPSLLASRYLHLLTPLGGAQRMFTACLFLIAKSLSQVQAAAL